MSISEIKAPQKLKRPAPGGSFGAVAVARVANAVPALAFTRKVFSIPGQGAMAAVLGPRAEGGFLPLSKLPGFTFGGMVRLTAAIEMLSSAITNGLRMHSGEISGRQAVGNVAADSVLGIGKATVSATATTLALSGLAAAGFAAGVPILVAGLGVGLGSYYLAGKAVDHSGLQPKIANFVEQAIA